MSERLKLSESRPILIPHAPIPKFGICEAVFETFFSYEKLDNPNLFKGIQNIFVILIKIVLILFKGNKLFFYQKNSNKILVIDKSYMFNHQLNNLDMTVGASWLSKERLDTSIVPHIITIRPSLINVTKIINLVWAREDLKLGQRLSAINSCVNYSLVDSEDFHSFVKKTLLKCSVCISNDPASPFVSSFITIAEPYKTEIKLICQTTVGSHSVEWESNSDKDIYVISSTELKIKLKEIFEIIAISISTKEQQIHAKERVFKFRALFAQQYYHSQAFKSRLRHFVLNVSIGRRVGTLIRIHPNESVLEKTLYQILGFFCIIKMSRWSLQTDMQNCRFALAFSSTVVEDFRKETGRPARYVHHANKIKSIKKD